jgi:excisionase family DNA binding protein
MSNEHAPERTKVRPKGKCRRQKDINTLRLAYDPNEVAAKLSCSRRHVYDMMADGTLASIKIGKLRRITHAELMRLVHGEPR